MRVTSRRELVWILELNDNEFSVLYNHLHGSKITVLGDEEVLENLKNLMGVTMAVK